MAAHDEPDEVGSDAWWSRDRKVTIDDLPKRSWRTRNDFVADLWDDQGWGDDEAPEVDETDVGQDHKRSGYGPRGGSVVRYTALGDRTVDKAVMALGMVQSFVDAFSTTDFGYTVVIDPKVKTAATSFTKKKVVIGATPLFDKSLTGRQCGLILTGTACHEVSHVLFDVDTRDAIARAFPAGAERRLALKVSNLLSENRIEARFSGRYPGYSDVFEPMLEYISRNIHGFEVEWDAATPSNFIVAAIRFAKWTRWTLPGMAAERDWWVALGQKACLNDTTKLHVQCVREAMLRITALNAQYPNPPLPYTPPPVIDEPPEAPADDDDEPSKHRFVPRATAPVSFATLPSANEYPNRYAAKCYQCGGLVGAAAGFTSRVVNPSGIASTQWHVRHNTCPR